MQSSLRFVPIDKMKDASPPIAEGNGPPSNIWRVDKGGNTKFVSPAVAKRLGMSQAEPSNRKIFDFVSEESIDALKASIRSRYLPQRYAFSVKRADGSKFYANIPSTPDAQAAEGPIGALYMPSSGGEELLAWVETEAQSPPLPPARRTQETAVRLQYEKEVLEVIMENTFAQIAYLDRDLRFLKVNSAFERGSGRESKELMGENLLGIFQSEENRTIFERVRSTGESVEFKASRLRFGHQQKGSGEYWDWSLVPVKDDRRRVQGFVLSLVDVTKQVEDREAIQRLAAEADAEKRRLRAILDTLPVGVVIVDAAGRMLEANAIADDTWRGFSHRRNRLDPSEFKGWWADTGIPLKSDDWGFAVALRTGKAQVGHVIDIMRQDSSRGTIIDSSAPIRDSAGNVIGAVSVIQDITHQRQLEQDALESKAKAELYLDILTKDLGSLSEAAIEHMSATLKSSKVDARSRKNLGLSLEALEEATKLIEVVGKIKRLEGHDLKYGLVDVGLLISDIVESETKKNGDRLAIDYKAPTWLTTNASGLLEDVFGYLIEDSLAKAKGPVKMEIHVSDAYEGGKQWHKIVFEDDVSTTQSDQRTGLFSLPRRGKEGTTVDDLRLYLIRLVVEDHQGRIWLESRVREDWKHGRRYVVMLPSSVVRQEVLSLHGSGEEEPD